VRGSSSAAFLRAVAATTLLALIALALAWELVLAPLRPGGSLLALKAAPLALPLAGIVAGRRRTYQWSPMLALLYFGEGVARSLSERGFTQVLAATQGLLALAFVAAAIGFVRATRAPG